MKDRRIGNKFNFKHGLRVSPTYNTWKGMKARCLNPNATSYESYGGIGITVSDRWLVFTNFLEDMGIRPTGTTLDRINSYGNYESGNCKWSTPAQQQRNRRTIKSTKSGYQGVYPGWGAGQWRAQIHIENVQYDLGTFSDLDTAVMMRLSAVEQLIIKEN